MKKIFFIILIIVIFIGGYLVYQQVKSNNLRQTDTDNVNLDDCEKIEESAAKGSCYSTIAINDNNSNLCEQTNDSLARDYCYAYSVGRLLDINLCEKISDNYAKNSCYVRFVDNSQADAKNISICEKIQIPTGGNNYDDQFLKDACYEEIAITTKNPSLCEKLVVISKNTCYSLSNK